jgi:hypothetical protein
MYYTSQLRRGGRAVECTSLENWQRLIAFLGFKSLSLRHFYTQETFLNQCKKHSKQLRSNHPSIIENTTSNHASKLAIANHSILTIFLYILFNDAVLNLWVIHNKTEFNILSPHKQTT